MSERLDICIFGATGYTGQFVVKEVARAFQKENFTWSIAGRSQEKMKKLLHSITNENGILNQIKIQ